MCVCVHRCGSVPVCLPLHACGLQKTTSALGPPLLTYFKTGFYCFSITCAMLARLWASGDSPVSTSHFNIDALGLQTCAPFVQFLCMFWRFELGSSGFCGKCFFTPSHLPSLPKIQHYHGKENQCKKTQRVSAWNWYLVSSVHIPVGKSCEAKAIIRKIANSILLWEVTGEESICWVVRESTLRAPHRNMTICRQPCNRNRLTLIKLLFPEQLM